MDRQYHESETMSISTELSNQDITSLAEDSDGYIWIGTLRGLNRYNGSDFHQYFYDSHDSINIPSNRINCLYTTKQGSLWVGTTAGACVYTDKDDFRRIGSNANLNNVHQIWENSEGRIFINMIAQLCEYIPETDSAKVIIEDFDPAHAYVNTCFLDSAGHVISVTNNLVRQFNERTMELSRQISTNLRPRVSYLDPISKLLWITAGDSIVVLDTDNFELCHTPQPIVDNIRDKIIRAIKRDGDFLYFVTGHGIFTYNK